jgi:uncharacterized membrane protein YhhN
MSYFLTYVAFGLAGLDWLAVWKKWKWLEYLAKPGVMLVLLAWLVSAGGYRGQLAWFALGLIFSMAGDIFLMLPKEQFIPGLVAFLLAHLAYIAGLNATLPQANLATFLLALLVGATGAKIFPALAKGLQAQGLEKLKGPVLAYAIIIGLMLLSALLTLARSDSEWRPLPSLLVSAGALLFYLSDTLLGWNKFVAPLPQARLKVMVAYHLGQIGLIAGAALNYL